MRCIRYFILLVSILCFANYTFAKRTRIANDSSLTLPNIIYVDSSIAYSDAAPHIEVINLQEYVVIGYGTSRKDNVSGAVVSLSPDYVPITESGDVLESVKGKLSGVSIKSSEGGLLSESEILIRGGNSITGDNSPLLVVDGFVVSNFDDVLSSQIERIDVLKDASSSAIYGSRAGGGVISITTKSPKKEGLHFDYHSSSGFRKIQGHCSTLSPYEFAKLSYENAALKGGEYYQSFVSMYGTYKELKKYKDYPDVNFVDELFSENGAFTRQSFSVSKVTESSKLKLAYQFDSNNGIMIGASERKHAISFQLAHTFSSLLSFDLRASYNNRNTYGAGISTAGSSVNSRLKNALYFSPISLSDADEESFELSSQIYSPIEAVNDDYRKARRNGLLADATLRVTPVQSLCFSSSFGIRASFIETQRAYGLATSQSRQFGNLPLASIQNNNSSTLRNTNLATYSPFLSFSHHLKLLAGHEFSLDKDRYVFSQSKYFPSYFSAKQTLANMSLGTADPIVSVVYPNVALLSFFTRAEYDWADKYLCSLSLRADRSSKFVKGKQWGTFPSGSIAWKVSEENWWKDNAIKSVVSYAKLRASVGATGNNRIADNLYENLYLAPTSSDKILNFDHNFSSYIKGVDYMANKNLTWETTVSRDLGLDFSLFNRVFFEFDIYSNSTKDLLLKLDLPFETGYDYVMKNVGETSNRGFDFSISADVLKQKRWSLNLSANLSHNVNRIVSLGGLDQITVSSGWAGTEIEGDYILKVGQPVGTFYGYETEGCYTVNDFNYDSEAEVYTLKSHVASDAELLAISELKPGMLKLKDQNNDGIIDEQDKIMLGSAQPKATGGFGLQATIFSFDLAMNFSFSVGGKVLNANKIEGTTSNKYLFRNMLSDVKGYYTYINKKGDIEIEPDKLTELNSNSTIWSPFIGRYVTHSWAIEDASYVRFENLSVGYSLPKRIVDRLHLEKCRLAFSVSNLFLWTRYSGLDPEVSVRRSSPATPNVDYSAHPRSRSFAFSLDLSF